MTEASRGRARSWRTALLWSVLVAAAGCGSPAAPATDTAASPPPPAPQQTYVPGRSYLGRNGYIEYIAGNSPVIYSAPHGGTLVPDEIPDRTAGPCGTTATTVSDLNTADLVLRMQQQHLARFGTWPHIVINRLHRRKLDANRARQEAACGDREADQAFDEWHAFLAAAVEAVTAGGGRGWYMDIHGHAHTAQRLELGWLLTGTTLRLSDAALDASPALEDSSSIRTLSVAAPASFSALLRGPDGLGTLFAAAGIPAVPSANDPAPAVGESYFNGGYNTVRYTCGVEAPALGGVGAGRICGVQIETHYTGVRDTEANRIRFGGVVAEVVERFLGTHWGLRLDGR